MGKFRSLIYFDGRTGNVVGRKGRDGSYITAMYQPSVKNPNTTEQQQVRAKFTLLTRFCSVLAGAIKPGFADEAAQGLTIQNAFMKYNFNTAISGTWPSYAIDYTRTLVSAGQVDLPYNPSASVDSGSLAVVWTDNTGLGDAMADDVAVLILYNTTKDTAVYTTNAGRRDSRQGSIEIPATWSGDNAEAWLYMTRPGGKKSSKSVHLGSFTL